MKKVSPCTPFKNFRTKGIKIKLLVHGQTGGASQRLALAAARNQGPPRPCFLRKLICCGAGRPGGRPLQKINRLSRFSIL